MKKFIIKTVLFFVFTILSYCVFLIFWIRYVPPVMKPNVRYNLGAYGHTFTRLLEVKKQNKLDILFLGSSHAYRGFDTRIFSKHGYKTFNLGSSAQTPSQTKVLLYRYLTELNPKMVVYEVYPPTFSIDGIESSLDIIANDKNDLYSFNMILKNNNIKTYNAFIYGITRDFLNLNKTFNEPVKKENDTYIAGGYVEKEMAYFKPLSFEERNISFSKSQIEKFSEIVSLLKSKNIKLILVYAPISKVFYKSFNNQSYFDNEMIKYSKYYNFNEIITLNDSLHFYDSNHLNQKGVELFDNKLIEILKAK